MNQPVQWDSAVLFLVFPMFPARFMTLEGLGRLCQNWTLATDPFPFDVHVTSKVRQLGDYCFATAVGSFETGQT